MTAATPRLIARSRLPDLPGIIELGEVTTIGRHPSNTIIISADSISRFHARIDKRGSYFVIQDLKSSNGTFVNGDRVTQVTLHDGDDVTLGAVEFRFEDVGSGSASSLDPGTVSSLVEFAEDTQPATRSVLTTDDFSRLRGKSSSFFTEAAEGEQAAMFARAHARLAALYNMSEMLRQAEEERLDTILERALEILFNAVSADRAVIMTRLSAETNALEVKAVRYRDNPITPETVKISRTILDEVLQNHVAILTTDAQTDDRFEASESIIMNQIHSAICVPLLMREEVVGVVHLESRSLSDSFHEDDLEFSTMIANELAMAIENIRMRREAVHRERLAAVGETVAGISHNIKNILLLMQGGSDLLNRALESGNTDTARESWGIVNRGIGKISTLVREMLDYSSNRKPRLAMVDINKMICKTAEEIEEQLLRRHVSLELDLDEDATPRPMDENGMARTIANIIVNAMEALPKAGGRIICATHQIGGDSGVLVVKISDNGVGIPRDKLEKIFLPFFTTKGSTGTGLGLPMCKKVLEDMGGSIEVDSEENVGTTFKLLIPRIPDDAVYGNDSNDTIEDETNNL